MNLEESNVNDGNAELSTKRLHTRNDYSKVFNPLSYLNNFYSNKDDEPAMHVMLKLLPNVANRLPKGGRLLDVGSGPTVHVALCFREFFDEIYLSDYVEQNTDAINDWLDANGRFDWSNISQYIAMVEGRGSDRWSEIEAEARRKIKGVLHCDVFQPTVIPPSENFGAQQFDIVTTIFCIEYASNNSDEYRTALGNVTNLIKSGGYLVMGGILEENHYHFGGTHYACHYLTEEELIDSLKSVGINVADAKTFKYFNHVGIFLIVGQRKMHELS